MNADKNDERSAHGSTKDPRRRSRPIEIIHCARHSETRCVRLETLKVATQAMLDEFGFTADNRVESMKNVFRILATLAEGQP